MNALIRAFEREILRMQVRLEQTEIRAKIAQVNADTIRGEIAVLENQVKIMRAGYPDYFAGGPTQ